MTMQAMDFLSAISGVARTTPPGVKLATIDAAYVASSYPGTLPRVTFDGESTLTVRRYACLYAPKPGDRVVMLPTGNTYTIVGAIGASGSGSDSWQAYSPAWTGTTTNPVIGSGSITGRWLQVGKAVTVAGRILMGADTTYGSGEWRISLPVTASQGSIGSGAVYFHDTDTAGNRRPGSCWLTSGTQLGFSSNPGPVTNLIPFLWASGDQLRWTFTYEVA